MAGQQKTRIYIEAIEQEERGGPFKIVAYSFPVFIGAM